MVLDHISFKGKERIWKQFVKKVKKENKKIWAVLEEDIKKYLEKK